MNWFRRLFGDSSTSQDETVPATRPPEQYVSFVLEVLQSRGQQKISTMLRHSQFSTGEAKRPITVVIAPEYVVAFSDLLVGIGVVRDKGLGYYAPEYSDRRISPESCAVVDKVIRLSRPKNVTQNGLRLALAKNELSQLAGLSLLLSQALPQSKDASLAKDTKALAHVVATLTYPIVEGTAEYRSAISATPAVATTELPGKTPQESSGAKPQEGCTNVRMKSLSKSDRDAVVAVVDTLNPDTSLAANPEAELKNMTKSEVDPGSGRVCDRSAARNWLDSNLQQLEEGVPANSWEFGRISYSLLPSRCPALLFIGVQVYGRTDGNITEARELIISVMRVGENQYWCHNGTRYQSVMDIEVR